MKPSKACEYCGREFFKGKDEGNDRWASRRFCSRPCNDKGRRRAPKAPITKICQCGKEFHKTYEMAWLKWANRKFCSKECADKWKIRKAPSTAFKKGDVPVNFKTDGYGYQAVHQWMNRHYPKTGVCKRCGEIKKTQWANISGKYLRVRTDYLELCYSCHTKMDGKNPKSPRIIGGPVSQP